MRYLALSALLLAACAEPKSHVLPPVYVQAQAPATRAAEPVRGFQKTTWGMTREEVLALYPEAEASPERVEARQDFAGMPARILFAFDSQGRLSSVVVGLEKSNAAPEAAVAEFDANRQLLLAKYGRPVSETLGHLQRAGLRPTQEQLLLMQGERLVARWSPPGTRISLISVRDAGGPYRHAITYRREPTERELREQKQQVLDDL